MKDINRKKIMRERYDQTHANYDARYWDIQIHKYSAFNSEFERITNSMIFDYGGGSGLLAKFIKKEIIIADISVNMLQEAKKYKNTHLIAADGEKLPVRTKSIDILASFSALQNLADPKKGIQEIIRVCRKTGTIILTVLEKKLPDEQMETILSSMGLHYKNREISVEDSGYIITL